MLHSFLPFLHPTTRHAGRPESETPASRHGVTEQKQTFTFHLSRQGGIPLGILFLEKVLRYLGVGVGWDGKRKVKG